MHYQEAPSSPRIPILLGLRAGPNVPANAAHVSPVRAELQRKALSTNSGHFRGGADRLSTSPAHVGIGSSTAGLCGASGRIDSRVGGRGVRENLIYRAAHPIRSSSAIVPGGSSNVGFLALSPSRPNSPRALVSDQRDREDGLSRGLRPFQ